MSEYGYELTRKALKVALGILRKQGYADTPIHELLFSIESAQGINRDQKTQLDAAVVEYRAPTQLDDQRTWPEVGSLWQHRNGNRYTVEAFTNMQPERQDTYPTMISYRNVENGEPYSRKLVDWDRSMTLIP